MSFGPELTGERAERDKVSLSHQGETVVEYQSRLRNIQLSLKLATLDNFVGDRAEKTYRKCQKLAIETWVAEWRKIVSLASFWYLRYASRPSPLRSCPRWRASATTGCSRVYSVLDCRFTPMGQTYLVSLDSFPREFWTEAQPELGIAIFRGLN